MNIHNLPLTGKIIINSSAGTGKTYLIGLIYLRLLLGIKKKKLNMQEILILTCNKTHVKRLKFDILKKINKMKIACIKKGIGLSKESIYRKLLHLIKDKRKAIDLLIHAEDNIHEANIYTINNFCKLIIKKNKFKLNLPIRQSIIKDDKKFQKQACEEFWRKNFYPMNYSISKVIFNIWKTPRKMFNQIKTFLNGKTPIFIKENNSKNIIKKHKKLINNIKKIKKIWIVNYKKSKKLITDSNINKHIYNKRNLSNWFNKITKWANSKTIDYEIPYELNYFSQNQLIKKTKKGPAPNSIFFSIIEKFIKKKITIKDLLISESIINVKKIIEQKKREKKKINPEDLLKNLNNTIKNKEKKKIIESIFNQYKTTIIDEYQETKKQQIKILQKIHKKRNCLILIGDLKQTIYESNNENIFYHIKTIKKIKKNYTIKKNWRSSTDITESINKLFSQKKNPFLIKQIPFKPLIYNEKNKNIKLIHKKKNVSALNLYSFKNEISYFEYKKRIADQCAKQIYDWIIHGKKKETWLLNKKKIKFLNASDITVLIRNKKEAWIIQKSLEKFNIDSKFICERQNFLDSNNITEIILILKAIMEPKNENILRSALATSLIGLTPKEIYNLNKNKKKIENKIIKFNEYLSTWNKFGILAALRKTIIEEKIDYKLLSDKKNGKKKLINLIHISELLQKKEKILINKKNLINWLNNKVYTPNTLSKEIQKKYEYNDKNKINISTIKQSKGLSYPIVWIPFDSYTIKNNIKTFHNRKNFKIYLDLTENKKNKKLAEQEYLSQKIRLLYVGLTRSIYHCSVGVTPLIKKKNNTFIFYKSILISLLKNKKYNSYEKILKKIKDKNINIKKVKKIKINILKTNKKIKFLTKKNIDLIIEKKWKITNYTDLINNKNYSEHNKITRQQKIKIKNKEKKENKSNLKNKKNIHYFPIGIKSGIFFHYLLKKINFNKTPNKKWITEKLKKFNFSPNWTIIIQKLLNNIFNIPLTKNNLKLSKIKPEKKIKEMKFYISINNVLHYSKLEKIRKKYDFLYKKKEKIKFQSFKGILNGSIDLIFYWEKKIYLIDYKSNWLGKNTSYYNLQSLQSVIIKKKYNFQYSIYTLATHRFLKHKIKNYNYKKHFGGVFYLFLRGCDINQPGYGIYHTIPSYHLIKNLDKIFK